MEKDLPKRWVETKLGVIAEWGSGGTPNRSEPKYYSGTIPWVKTGDLNDSIILEASEYITELGLKKSSAKLFPKGSIIVAMYGATIGKTAKLGIDATTNQACAVAKASRIVVTEFLHYFLKSEKQEFIEKGKGGAQPNISQTVIKEHPFPLPPFPEQQRIVAKLDTLFGHLDALKTRLDRIPQLLKDFRQKVLTQAVTGKLTEEWREGKELGKWVAIDLKDITEIDVGQAFKSAEFEDSGIRLLRGENIEPGALRWINTMYFPKEKLQKYSHLYIEEGDVILAMDRPIISTGLKLAKAKKEDLPCVLVQRVARFRPSKKLLSGFLYFLISSNSYIKHLFGEQTGTQIPHISSKQILSYKCMLPLIEEQQEIVRRVESLFAKADRIEASYQKLKAKLEQLPQALLAKAFRGELVEQLPTDGNARELLEEIRKAKAGLEKGGKSRKVKENDELRMVAEDGARYGKK